MQHDQEQEDSAAEHAALAVPGRPEGPAGRHYPEQEHRDWPVRDRLWRGGGTTRCMYFIIYEIL